MARPLDSFPDVSTFPDIPCPERNRILAAVPTGKAFEQARDWPFMSPEEYDRKWNSIQGPETDPLAAAQAASIASNLEVDSGTDDDIPEPPESEEEPEKWEPRDMKTTVITRDNINHFNNPFA